jgi:hypothetical protein
VVSSAVPSIVEHDSPAVVVDALSIDAIASGLGEVATDDSLRESLAAAGLASVAGRTWVVAAQRHIDWWTGIVR